MVRIVFVLILNLFSVVGYLLDFVMHTVTSLFQRSPTYVRLKLHSSYPFTQTGGFAKLTGGQTTFLDIRRGLKKLVGDERVDGLVLEIDQVTMGPGRIAELSNLLDEVREGGTEIIAHMETPLARDYILASSATHILAPPAARLYTFALRFEQFFAAALLEKLGITVQFAHIGEFKAAANRFLHKTMPLSQRLMMEDLRDSLQTHATNRIRARREHAADHAELWNEEAPLEARQAVTDGFLDALVFRPDLKRWINERGLHSSRENPSDNKEPAEPEILSFDHYLDGGAGPELNWRPLRRKKQIAILDLSGMIVVPDMNLPGGSARINPAEVIPVLRALGKNKRVAAVILHINSPGGSALSSDLIWQAVDTLRAQKPVIAYCSDLVASGGYYIAVGADRIYCRPESIVGSIGVIAGKFAVAEALDQVGIKAESVSGDDASTFASMFEPMPESALHRLKGDIRAFYRTFLERVGQSRSIPRHRLHRYARGRVYTGDSALKRGLVDGLGGLEEAYSAALELAELSEDQAVLHPVSHRKQSLGAALKGSVMSAPGLTKALQEVDVLELLRTEQVLALMNLKPDELFN